MEPAEIRARSAVAPSGLSDDLCELPLLFPLPLLLLLLLLLSSVSVLVVLCFLSEPVHMLIWAEQVEVEAVLTVPARVDFSRLVSGVVVRRGT